MPVASVKKLTPEAGDAQMKAAMSDCVATEMKNGMPQDQAVAACSQMMQEKTGKSTAKKETV